MSFSSTCDFCYFGNQTFDQTINRAAIENPTNYTKLISYSMKIVSLVEYAINDQTNYLARSPVSEKSNKCYH